MAYLANSTYEAIRANPSLIVNYYNQVKDIFARDLAMPRVSQELLKAAFCSVVAYGLAPYGKYTKPTVELSDLLDSPLHNCATYMYLTWRLLEKFGPPTISTISVGWDNGAVGNHAQLLVSDGNQSLLLDPTIGLVVYGVTFEGLLNADRFDDMKSFISRNELNSFNDNVIKAVSTGLYHPKDVIYKFDTLNDLDNNYMDGLREGLDFIDRTGNKFFIGTLFNDTLTFDSSANIVYGGKGNDTMWLGGGNDYGYGGLGHDTLFGQTGRDILYGEEGNDSLYGQLGNDILFGGDGNDWLVGNAGADRLTGGKGADTFRYQSIFDSGLTSSLADIIIDFSSTERDKIDISAIDANLITSGNQNFKFIEHNKFNAPGQVRVFYTADETRIICNIDSNINNFEFLIRLSGHHELTSVDFLL